MKTKGLVSPKQSTGGPVSPKRSGGGQTMILTVILITTAILSATVISALLILFQLRQVSDIKASTQAIFAADSGIECVLYEKFVGGERYQNCAEVKLTNDTLYVVVDQGDGSFKSIGKSGRTARAFEIGF